MLLTITCEMENAADLGYLLHKNPASIYEATTSFGTIRVFYPEAEEQCCTAALLLEVDPIKLVRGNGRHAATLEHYVNDRPYVASSLMSVALVEAFGSAMNGRSKERPERVGEKLPLRAHIAALRCAGGADLAARLFAPLGYTVIAQREPLDTRFPDWGPSDIYAITLEGTHSVQDLLTHLYVLIPVLDNAKHYYIGVDEVEKLMAKGERWLPTHPEAELIVQRYLNYRREMVRQAMVHIQELREDSTETQDETDTREEAQETAVEEPIRLNDARLEAAMNAILASNPPALRVLDLGCGEGRLLKKLLAEPRIEEVVGVDVAAHTLDRAARRLRLDTLSERQRARIRLLQGSLVYRDDRFQGFDVAVLMEVIEHLDPPRLAALERVVLEHARPRRLLVTTPNQEYNVNWPSLPAGRFRHRDHRFEWTRAEFAAWAERVAARTSYTVQFLGIGPEDPAHGCPTQMALFDLQKR